MFAVGHMGIAYILGKGSAKPLKLKPNIPLLLVLSVLPDVDIIFENLLGVPLHRGVTHSLLFAVILFTPIFIIYRQKAIPYFLALLSHSLIGDFFVGGHLQLLWPLPYLFGLQESGSIYISIYSNLNIFFELSLFTASTALMVKTRDIRVFFKKQRINLVLIIPLVTVLLPTFVGYPFNQPLLFTLPLLAFAQLFYLVLFSSATLIALYAIIKKPKIMIATPNSKTS